MMASEQVNRTTVTAKIVLALASLVVTLMSGEMVIRVIAPAMNRRPIIVSDLHAGWALRPNLKEVNTVHGRNRFAISSDKDGRRICYAIDQSPPIDAPMLIVVGDSFAMGVGVSDQQTFAGRLAQLTPYNVVNLGVLGYGTDQELIHLEDFLSARPGAVVKHIIVLIFDNDFWDVQQTVDRYLGRTKPRFYLSDQGLVRPAYRTSWEDHLMDVSWLFWLLNSKRALILARPYPPSAGGIDLVLACTRAMRALAESRRAQLHLFAYHRLKDPLPLTILEWQRFVAQAGAIDITERIREVREPNPIGSDDLHWSATGHALVAKILLEYLKNGAADDQKSHETGPGPTVHH